MESANKGYTWAGGQWINDSTWTQSKDSVTGSYVDSLYQLHLVGDPCFEDLRKSGAKASTFVPSSLESKRKAQFHILECLRAFYILESKGRLDNPKGWEIANEIKKNSKRIQECMEKVTDEDIQLENKFKIINDQATKDVKSVTK